MQGFYFHQTSTNTKLAKKNRLINWLGHLGIDLLIFRYIMTTDNQVTFSNSVFYEFVHISLSYRPCFKTC